MQILKPLLSPDLKDIPLLKKGKVRNVYDMGNELLFVTSDRISAFDVILPSGIPEKGKVLNMISVFWFEFTKNIIKNHVITANPDEMVSLKECLAPYKDMLTGRSMLVKKAEPIMAECVVRGYISGSAWKDYQKTGMVCGIKLPEGLSESQKLPEPIFTPSTKADVGHDMNVSEKEIAGVVGENVIAFLKEKSLALYVAASDYALSKGIIIADTKFEFGKIGNEIILVDEALSPDSSRFWPEDDYQPGRAQKSFDKQFVRDYLETIDWDKTSPGPLLPEDIALKTSEKYKEAYKILTGKELK